MFHYFICCNQFCHQRKYFLQLHSSFFALKPLAPKHCGCLCAQAVQCTSQLWLSIFTLELETSGCGTFVPKHPGLKRVGGFACAVLTVMCLSQWQAICSDRHQARCYPKHRHCDSLGPSPSLASHKL